MRLWFYPRNGGCYKQNTMSPQLGDAGECNPWKAKSKDSWGCMRRGDPSTTSMIPLKEELLIVVDQFTQVGDIRRSCSQNIFP
jgi:hypothetical protein